MKEPQTKYSNIQHIFLSSIFFYIAFCVHLQSVTNNTLDSRNKMLKYEIWALKTSNIPLIRQNSTATQLSLRRISFTPQFWQFFDMRPSHVDKGKSNLTILLICKSANLDDNSFPSSAHSAFRYKPQHSCSWVGGKQHQ